MRTPRALRLAVAAVALTCAGAAVATTGIAGAVDDVPTAEEVAAAEAAAAGSANDVAEVQRRLATARAQLDAVTIRTAQLSEAYNGAQYRLAKARARADKAQVRAQRATDEAADQLDSYQKALVASYQMAPELHGWSAILTSDGIEEAIENSATLEVAEDALGARYDELEHARTEAREASAEAKAARARADHAADEARAARDAAIAAQAQAEASMADIAAQEQALIERWAELEGISVELAKQRNEALAAQDSTPAPQAPETTHPSESPQPSSGGNHSGGTPSQGPTKNPTTQPSQPAPTGNPSTPAAPTTPPTTPPTTDPDPPAPASGAAKAIAFAKAQIGEPYRWGAAGPNAWDCSGLTMGAWNAGGKSLPHYSVAQYQQSTPISRSQLQPGDLVFWGSSSKSTSIYHVALYIGNGTIIHAPRTGRPVAEESIDYWIAPNFFARP